MPRRPIAHTGRLAEPVADRLVLESISMFNYTRAELYDSPEGYRLLNLIRDLWYAADQFNAAVSGYPTLAERVAAGRLTFPNVAAAFEPIRGSLDRVPVNAIRTDANFSNLSRVIAVIGPLLDQAPPSSIAGTTNSEEPVGLDASRVQAQEIARDSALQGKLKKSPAPLARARGRAAACHARSTDPGLWPCGTGRARRARGRVGFSPDPVAIGQVTPSHLCASDLASLTLKNQWRAVTQHD